MPDQACESCRFWCPPPSGEIIGICCLPGSPEETVQSFPTAGNYCPFYIAVMIRCETCCHWFAHPEDLSWGTCTYGPPSRRRPRPETRSTYGRACAHHAERPCCSAVIPDTFAPGVLPVDSRI